MIDATEPWTLSSRLNGSEKGKQRGPPSLLIMLILFFGKSPRYQALLAKSSNNPVG